MVERKTPYPRCSMYGLFTYIWVVLGVGVGKYTSPIEHLGMDDLEFPRFAAAGPQCKSWHVFLGANVHTS